MSSTPAPAAVYVEGVLRYERIRQIGVGQGMNSIVWQARDAQHGGLIAVKEIPRNMLGGASFHDWFGEAKAMHASANPKNVVPLLYACDCPKEPHVSIAMPLYRDGSLFDRIQQNPLSLKEARRIGLGILNGLHQIHLAKIIHCDIRPSNILFANKNTPMVSDFGQAVLLDKWGTAALPAMHPDGLPPEFFNGNIGTMETDIFLTGVTLYRAVNGDPFFTPQKPADAVECCKRALDGTFPNSETFLPHVPNSMRQAIRTALSVERGERYASATAFQDALSKVSIPLDWTVEQTPDGSIT